MKALAYIGLSVAALLGGACTREQLDYRKQEGFVYLALNWEEGFAPAGSRIYFYPAAGGAALVYDCAAEGFAGVLPVGSYRVLALNNDSQNVAVRHAETYEGAELYVLPEEGASASRAASYVLQADEVAYAAGINEAPTLEVPYRDTVRVTASPQSCVKHVQLRFVVVPPAQVTRCSGSLTGVSPSLACASGARAATAAAVRFTAVADAADPNLFTTDIAVLDLVRSEGTQGSQPTHWLDLTLTDPSGNTWPLQVDLSKEVDDCFTQTGELPHEILLHIRLAQIDDQLTATVVPWDGGGTGGGIL